MSETSPDRPEDPLRSGSGSSRRKALTPELRRLLATPRAPRQEAPPPAVEFVPGAEPTQLTLPPDEQFSGPEDDPIPEIRAVPEPAAERWRGGVVVAETKESRRVEMRHAFLVLGLLAFFVLIFIAGRKFDRMKYLVTSHLNGAELQGGPEHFPGLTSDELVEGAIAAEKDGDWVGAAQRLLEAKRKDLQYQGILFRIGKGSFDRSDWNGADQALENAIRFGENVAVANQLRGLIAIRRHDLPAAERFFEAATKAEPFVADFFFYWGEALRLNQHPREAIRRYEQAIRRTPSTTDASLCQFKVRLARIEAAEAAAVSDEVAEKRKAGPLSVDWLMTDAALQLHAGKIKEAVQSIAQARAGGISGLFLTCAGDTIFAKASDAHPEIAAVVVTTSTRAQPETPLP